MLKNMKTLYQEGNAELVVKKSKFLAVAKPVSNEQEAQAVIEALKKKYWDAAHTVFAYQIGERNEIQRYSDDGEPSGTAGIPLLDILRGQSIQNAMIAVTRYFGGTLLGTGGLVRAYGHSGGEAVRSAEVIEKNLYESLKIFTDYTSFGKIQYAALQNEHIIQKVNYTEQVEMDVLVLTDAAGSFIKEIADLTAGQAQVEKGSPVYAARVSEEYVIL